MRFQTACSRRSTRGRRGVSIASRDLCGGRSVMSVPTATVRPTVELPASDLQLLTVTDMLRPALRMARARKDVSSNVTAVGTRSSTLRQPRLPHAIHIMVEVLGVLVDEKTFGAFDRETGIDPQHFRGCGSRLLKLSRLGMGARQRDMRPLQTGLARYAFAAPMHRVRVTSASAPHDPPARRQTMPQSHGHR